MATTAQIDANRTNAQASTGPKTAEGKAKSSQNAVSLGLFTKQNCVQPEEQEEYNNLYNALWQDLNPEGAMEEMFATEIIRGAWRLRRCATAENYAGRMVNKGHRREHEQIYGKDTPYGGACDPIIYQHTSATQIAVDRARAQATGAIRRATADLRRLQTERLSRAATLPENADASRFGLASFQEVVPKLHNEAKAQLLAALPPCGAGCQRCQPAADWQSASANVSQSSSMSTNPPAPAQIKAEPDHRPAEVTEILQSAA